MVIDEDRKVTRCRLHKTVGTIVRNEAFPLSGMKATGRF